MTLVACAAVLTSAIAFTGCKSGQNEPNKVVGTVKTEFAVTLPDQVRGGQNRMPAKTAQEGGLSDFQGITDITIIPFAATLVTASDSRLGGNIILTQTVADNFTSTDASKASSAKVYENVDVPLTTSSFLFYGKSAKTGTKAETGSLVADIDNANPSAYSFSLDKIKGDFATTVLGAGQKGDLLKTYLTSIASAEADGTKWYEYNANSGLQDMFTTFSSMHGLSSFEIARVLTDLNKSLDPLVSSNTMAAAIRAAIKAGSDYVTVDDGTNEVTMKSQYDNFPQEYGLPVGCVDIAWNTSEHAFKDGLYSNMANPATFVYPAQLWYYVNSPIKTSNTSKKTMYDANDTEWGAILNAHGDGTSVSTQTRAIVIEDTIQYAVARLDVQVKLNSESLADNSEAAVGIATPVSCAAGFKVTGILVGGQKNVGWDFTPITSTEYTIYDNLMTNSAMKAESTGYSVVNHTLVLENAQKTNVRIAVELENPSTGVDFYGVDNKLIAKGSKFYVIAELDATLATKTDRHVFMQDYVTTAKLTLKDLKHAYNTLPDLRTPKLEVGFSVNLNWKSGNTYEINFQ